MSERWMTMVPSDQFEREKLRADAAEAEAARLREERDAALRDYVARDRYDAMQFVYMAEVEKREAAEARCARLQQALAAYEYWGSRMPDAGFNINDPRWNWWHARPYEQAREALAGPDTPADSQPEEPTT